MLDTLVGEDVVLESDKRGKIQSVTTEFAEILLSKDTKVRRINVLKMMKALRNEPCWAASTESKLKKTTFLVWLNLIIMFESYFHTAQPTVRDLTRASTALVSSGPLRS
jgi:hypothetical protein